MAVLQVSESPYPQEITKPCCSSPLHLVVDCVFYVHTVFGLSFKKYIKDFMAFNTSEITLFYVSAK